MSVSWCGCTLPTCTKYCTLSNSIPYILNVNERAHKFRFTCLDVNYSSASVALQRFSQSYMSRSKSFVLSFYCNRDVRKTSVSRHQDRNRGIQCHLNNRLPRCSGEREVEWCAADPVSTVAWGLLNPTERNKDELQRCTWCVCADFIVCSRHLHLNILSNKF